MRIFIIDYARKMRFVELTLISIISDFDMLESR